ncbi:hypothetical protein CBW52_00520 [Yersinia kristensenii]|uniref:Uncharacterized protein n=1 Tax=Yersinia kristensenii TaxID=28152 RepID=A0AB73PS58_YERKR|nr:hypothetical protein CBW52_00520 [Yersinia kristensenii]
MISIAIPAIRRVVNNNNIYSSVSEGLTAPRGTPVAYATTTPTARFPSFDFFSNLKHPLSGG